MSLAQIWNREPSLARRLVVGAVLWSLLVLGLGGYTLSGLYRDSVLRGLDRELENNLLTLLAGVSTDAEGVVSLAKPPTDPRYERVYSGRYWAVVPVAAAKPASGPRGAGAIGGPETAPLFQSRSVWDSTNFWPPAWAQAGSQAGALASGQNGFATARGPDDQKLRILGQSVRLPDRPLPVLLLMAADTRPALADARQFTATLLLSLAALCAVLVSAILIQVRIGLAPLRRLSEDFKRVSRGDADRLAGSYPREIAPLATEVNVLLDANREVVERARTHVGNLAHALKTPISVLLNEAREQQSGFSAIVRRQAEAMSANVTHYLKRAQAAARAENARARTEAKPVLEDLVRVIGKLYGGQRALAFRFEIHGSAQAGGAGPGGTGFVFRGERQDLEEMAGNLLDNAGKWAKSRVTLGLRAAGSSPAMIEIDVDDDGPGLAPEAREAAVRRGVRLDESAPGTGLGLSIVDELARAYGGTLSLGESRLGGLRATLRLPGTG